MASTTAPAPDEPGDGKKKKRKVASAFRRSPLKGYNPAPAWYGWGSAQLDGSPVFLWPDVPRMLRDPQIRFVERMWRAPFQKVKWSVSASNKAVAQFVGAMLRRFWVRSLPKLLSRYFRYGFAPGAAEFAPIRGRVRLVKVRAVEPLDAQARVWNEDHERAGELAGFDVAQHAALMPTGARGNLTICSPHLFWFAGHGDLTQFHDAPPLSGCFEPWLEKRGRGGAIQSRKLWFRKAAWRGGIMYYPDGTSNAGSPENPQVIDNQDLARQGLDTLEAGGSMTIISDVHPANPSMKKWEYQPPESYADVAGLREYPQDLDREILVGAGIPPEVLEASEVGSGWSGRMVPLMGYLGTVDELAGLLIEACDSWLAPLVALNFGENAWYEVKPQSLVDELQQQGAMPGGGQPGLNPSSLFDGKPPAGGPSGGGGDGPQQPGPGGSGGPLSLSVTIPEDLIRKAERAAGGHKYACAHVEVPRELAAHLKTLAYSIPNADLHDPANGKGRELESHVTVRFGLLTDEAADLAPIAADAPPARVTFTGIGHFDGAAEGKPYDVVFAAVDSADLRRLNRELAALPHHDTHPEYVPHATIAYVRAGAGALWARQLTLLSGGLAGAAFVAPALTLSARDGNKTEVPLGGWGALELSEGAAHAPAGGVTVQGKEFKGGEFIPADVMAQATQDEKAKVKGGKASGVATGKKDGIRPLKLAKLPETKEEADAIATALRDRIVGDDPEARAETGQCIDASTELRALGSDVEIFTGVYPGEWEEGGFHRINKIGDWYIDVTADQFDGPDVVVMSAAEFKAAQYGQGPYWKYGGFRRDRSAEYEADLRNPNDTGGSGFLRDLALYEGGEDLVPPENAARTGGEPLELGWTRYAGPMGGTGWVSDTGEVRYQESEPADHEASPETGVESIFAHPDFAHIPSDNSDVGAVRAEFHDKATADGLDPAELHRRAAERVDRSARLALQNEPELMPAAKAVAELERRHAATVKSAKTLAEAVAGDRQSLAVHDDAITSDPKNADLYNGYKKEVLDRIASREPDQKKMEGHAADYAAKLAKARAGHVVQPMTRARLARVSYERAHAELTAERASKEFARDFADRYFEEDDPKKRARAFVGAFTGDDNLDPTQLPEDTRAAVAEDLAHLPTNKLAEIVAEVSTNWGWPEAAGTPGEAVAVFHAALEMAAAGKRAKPVPFDASKPGDYVLYHDADVDGDLMDGARALARTIAPAAGAKFAGDDALVVKKGSALHKALEDHDSGVDLDDESALQKLFAGAKSEPMLAVGDVPASARDYGGTSGSKGTGEFAPEEGWNPNAVATYRRISDGVFVRQRAAGDADSEPFELVHRKDVPDLTRLPAPYWEGLRDDGDTDADLEETAQRRADKTSDTGAAQKRDIGQWKNQIREHQKAIRGHRDAWNRALAGVPEEDRPEEPDWDGPDASALTDQHDTREDHESALSELSYAMEDHASDLAAEVEAARAHAEEYRAQNGKHAEARAKHVAAWNDAHAKIGEQLARFAPAYEKYARADVTLNDELGTATGTWRASIPDTAEDEDAEAALQAVHEALDDIDAGDYPDHSHNTLDPSDFEPTAESALPSDEDGTPEELAELAEAAAQARADQLDQIGSDTDYLLEQWPEQSRKWRASVRADLDAARERVREALELPEDVLTAEDGRAALEALAKQLDAYGKKLAGEGPRELSATIGPDGGDPNAMVAGQTRRLMRQRKAQLARALAVAMVRVQLGAAESGDPASAGPKLAQLSALAGGGAQEQPAQQQPAQQQPAQQPAPGDAGEGVTLGPLELSWEPYVGKRGARAGQQVGWRDSETGQVRYQKSKPGEHAEKRQTRQASEERGREILRAVANKTATSDDLRELVTHLPVMSTKALRNAKIMLDAKFGNNRRHAQMVESLLARVGGIPGADGAKIDGTKAEPERLPWQQRPAAGAEDGARPAAEPAGVAAPSRASATSPALPNAAGASGGSSWMPGAQTARKPAEAASGSGAGALEFDQQVKEWGGLPNLSPQQMDEFRKQYAAVHEAHGANGTDNPLASGAEKGKILVAAMRVNSEADPGTAAAQPAPTGTPAAPAQPSAAPDYSKFDALLRTSTDRAQAEQIARATGVPVRPEVATALPAKGGYAEWLRGTGPATLKAAAGSPAVDRAELLEAVKQVYGDAVHAHANKKSKQGIADLLAGAKPLAGSAAPVRAPSTGSDTSPANFPGASAGQQAGAPQAFAGASTHRPRSVVDSQNPNTGVSRAEEPSQPRTGLADDRGVGGGGAAGTAGEAGIRGARPRIVTAREQFTRPANPGVVPESVRPHLNDAQVHGASLAIDAMTKHGGFLLADGTGVGKTRQQLAVAKHWMDKGKKVVIVSPAEVIKPDWKKGTVTGSFANDSQAMGVNVDLGKGDDALKPGSARVTTYNELGKLKDQIDGNTVVLFDESHNMKNRDSARHKHGKEIAEKAHSVMYATATPGDKPLHIAHLVRAGVFGDAGSTKTFEKLGMKLVDQHVGGGQYRKVWQIDPKVGYGEAMRRLSGLFDQMTKDGLMVKRELSMHGVDVGMTHAPLSQAQHDEVDKVFKDKLRETGGNKAVALMAARLHQEPMKIPHTVDAVREELAAGRSPVVFVGRVNDIGTSEGDDADEPTGPESAGTAKALRDALIAAGVPAEHIGELHGGATTTAAQKKKAMDGFQSGKHKVMIATVQSGGTGINLDDTTGTRPRTVIMTTPPFTANDMAQAIGRVHRLNTKSNSKVRAILSDTEIDRWNAELLKNKFRALGAIAGGQSTAGAAALRPSDAPESPDADAQVFDWGESLERKPRVYANTPFVHNDLIGQFDGRRVQRNGEWTTEFRSQEAYDKYRAHLEAQKSKLLPPALAGTTTGAPAKYKRVSTQNGERSVHTMPVPKSYWDRVHKSRPGYLSVRKHPQTGQWELSVWGKDDGEVESNLADLRKRL